MISKITPVIFYHSNSRSNKICVERSEYSEAREQRAPGRERVQNAIYDSGQGADMLSSFLLYLPFAPRGIKMSSAASIPRLANSEPPDANASKTKKEVVARRQGQGADYAFQIEIRGRGDIFTYFSDPLKNASRYCKNNVERSEFSDARKKHLIFLHRAGGCNTSFRHMDALRKSVLHPGLFNRMITTDTPLCPPRIYPRLKRASRPICNVA